MIGEDTAADSFTTPLARLLKVVADVVVPGMKIPPVLFNVTVPLLFHTAFCKLTSEAPTVVAPAVVSVPPPVIVPPVKFSAPLNLALAARVSVLERVAAPALRNPSPTFVLVIDRVPLNASVPAPVSNTPAPTFTLPAMVIAPALTVMSPVVVVALRLVPPVTVSAVVRVLVNAAEARLLFSGLVSVTSLTPLPVMVRFLAPKLSVPDWVRL